MTKSVIHSDPSNVDKKPAEVVVKGPNSVDVSLTPEAAIETASRLINNAADAKGKAMLQNDVAKRTLRLRHGGPSEPAAGSRPGSD